MEHSGHASITAPKPLIIGATMFLQLSRARMLLNRYLRRFVGVLSAIDAFRLTQRLERRVPDDLKGPATRAILLNAVIEVATRHGVPVRA